MARNTITFYILTVTPYNTIFMFRVETSRMVLNFSSVWNLRHYIKIGNAETESKEETNTT